MKGKGHVLFLGTAVVMLGASAVLWWALFRDGFTLEGALTPIGITVFGLFWLGMGLREKGG